MAGSGVRVGTWWDEESWQAARAGYLAGLELDPEGPDSFRTWLDAVLLDHARRTPRERAELAAGVPPLARGAGFGRDYVLTRTTVQAVEAAIAADRRQTGRFVSRSQFVREATAAAVARARDALGGHLPPAPTQPLPTGPRRAS